MAITEDPDDFSRNENPHRQKMLDDEARTRQQIELRIRNIDRCFQAVILPAVHSVENDLKLAGYGYKLTIDHFPDTGEPLVREVVFYFYPDRTAGPVHTQKALEAACRASIAATGDYRKLIFSIHFPRRLPPVAETQEIARAVDDIDSRVVDSFLETFIKGAIDVYRSDRVLL